MSYGEYLDFKKTSIILEELNQLDSTLESNLYTRFKSYNVQTTVVNKSELFNSLTDPDKPATVYPNFCIRTNRKPMSPDKSSCFPIVKAPGLTVPKYLKKPVRCSTLISAKCVSSYCYCQVIYN